MRRCNSRQKPPRRLPSTLIIGKNDNTSLKRQSVEGIRWFEGVSVGDNGRGGAGALFTRKFLLPNNNCSTLLFGGRMKELTVPTVLFDFSTLEY